MDKRKRVLLASLLFGMASSAIAQTDLEEVPAGPNPLAALDGRSFVGRLAPHDSIYFIYGADDPAAKFQFSFKYRLFGSWDDKATGARPSLNVAYTQRSLWDIEADSSPFFDTSYIPEAFFESSRPQGASWGPFTWWGFQTGVRHESNGRDGLNSRSMDMVYARPVFSIGPVDGWHAIFVPEAFTYIDDLDDNPDLPEYQGYGQLKGAILKSDGAALNYMVRSGKDWDRITYQLDLTIPVQADFLDLATYLHIQYFDGYGESLLSYRQKSEVLRVGFSLVR